MPAKADAPVEPETDLRLPEERDWPRPWQGPFLHALSMIPEVASAARQAGISRAAVYQHRDSNPAFAAAWDEALALAHDNVIRMAHKWIMTGAPVKTHRKKTVRKLNEKGELVIVSEEIFETESAERSATLMIFWLKAFHPDRFRWSERVEASGPDGRPIQVEALENVDAQIAALAAEIRERAKGEPVPDE